MLTNIAMAAKHLHAQVRRLQTHLGEETLEDGCVETQLVVVVFMGSRVVFDHRIEHLVGNLSRTVHHRAATLGNGLLGQQHTAYIGVPDQSIGHLIGFFLARQRAHGATLLGIGQSTLKRQLCVCHALNGGANAGCVHEGKHRLQTFVGLGNHGTDRTIKIQHRRGVGSDAHLVLQRTAAHAIACTHSAISAHHELRHDEE